MHSFKKYLVTAAILMMKLKYFALEQKILGLMIVFVKCISSYKGKLFQYISPLIKY